MSSENLGTREEPEITVVQEGEINSVNGAGILVLKDGARIAGDTHFEGLVIFDSVSEEQLFSGGNNTLYGSMIVRGEGDEDIELGDEEDVELAGTPSILFSREGLLSALRAMNIELLSHVSWNIKHRED